MGEKGSLSADVNDVSCVPMCSPPPPLSISARCRSVERNRIGLTAQCAEEHRGLEETCFDTTVLSPSGQVALIYDKMKCLEMDP